MAARSRPREIVGLAPQRLPALPRSATLRARRRRDCAYSNAHNVRHTETGLAAHGLDEHRVFAQPALAAVPPTLSVHDLHGQPRAPPVVLILVGVRKLCDGYSGCAVVGLENVCRVWCWDALALRTRKEAVPSWSVNRARWRVS